MICMVTNLPTANFILRGKSEKYIKENMLVEHFGSHFSQNGPLNLISWPHCHIFNTLSIDTNIVYSHGHMAIWLYDHMALFWFYFYHALLRYSLNSDDGCLVASHIVIVCSSSEYYVEAVLRYIFTERHGTTLAIQDDYIKNKLTTLVLHTSVHNNLKD